MIGIIFAFLLTLIHFFSKKISKKIEKYHINITSFSAGMFITLIFLHFLPSIIPGLEYKAPVFLALTIGFILFHLTEKYIYQHVKDKKILIRDIAELHTIGFFTYHLMIGFTLYLTLELNTYTNYLIIIPFVLHTISSSISLQKIHRVIKTGYNRFLLKNSTLIGAVLAAFIKLENFWYYTFLSFLLGSLLYISMRDMIPKGRKGSPSMFLIGFLTTLAILSVV